MPRPTAPAWPHVGAVGDVLDVEAIQRYLGPASSQVSAAVARCVLLPQATKDAWYVLAARIVAYVSATATADMLPEGQNLRAALVTTMANLQAQGCGDVASNVYHAPPPVMAPPPQGRPGTLFTSLLPNLEGVVLLALAFLFFRGRR